MSWPSGSFSQILDKSWGHSVPRLGKQVAFSNSHGNWIGPGQLVDSVTRSPKASLNNAGFVFPVLPCPDEILVAPSLSRIIRPPEHQLGISRCASAVSQWRNRA